MLMVTFDSQGMKSYQCSIVILDLGRTTDNRQRVRVRDNAVNNYYTRSSAIAEGPREALVSRNPTTTKHLT